MRHPLALDLLAAGLLLWDPFWRLLGVKAVSPKALRKALGPETSGGEAGGSVRPLLLDVRTRAEFDLFHIPGAEHRPDLLLHPERLEADRRRPAVVLCLTGHRSSLAAYGLKRRGFADVSSLVSGMLGYVLSGGSVVSSGTPEPRPTDAPLAAPDIGSRRPEIPVEGRAGESKPPSLQPPESFHRRSTLQNTQPIAGDA